MKALTRREKSLLPLIADGLSNKEIAHRLGVCENTVKINLAHIFQKVGVDNRTQLANWVRNGSLVKFDKPVDPISFEAIRAYLMTAEFTLEQGRELLFIIMDRSRSRVSRSVRDYRTNPDLNPPAIIPFDKLRAA